MSSSPTSPRARALGNPNVSPLLGQPMARPSSVVSLMIRFGCGPSSHERGFVGWLVRFSFAMFSRLCCLYPQNQKHIIALAFVPVPCKIALYAELFHCTGILSSQVRLEGMFVELFTQKSSEVVRRTLSMATFTKSTCQNKRHIKASLRPEQGTPSPWLAQRPWLVR